MRSAECRMPNLNRASLRRLLHRERLSAAWRTARVGNRAAAWRCSGVRELAGGAGNGASAEATGVTTLETTVEAAVISARICGATVFREYPFKYRARPK